MPRYDDKHVKINNAIIAWDGITSPETVAQGANAGKTKWTMKIVVAPDNPDLGEFDKLANECLQQSEFKGQLPHGGRMPIMPVQPGEPLHEFFPGHYCIALKTTLRIPDIYSEEGQKLDIMQAGGMIYAGQVVNVLAHCYAYNSAGNKGVSGGLDGFQIVTSAGAQPLPISGGVDTSGAFGGGGQQQPGGYNPQGQGQQQPGGYNPQGQGQQQQGGYNPQGQGQQQQGGYNPQGQGQQQPGGYNPQGQGQQQQGGYNPQGQGQQQQGGYNPQGQGQQQQGGYNPQGQGQQQPGGYNPQGQGQQQPGGYNPQGQGQQQQGGYNPQGQGQQQQGGYNPQGQGQQQQGGYNPQQQGQQQQPGGQAHNYLPGGR